MILNRKNGNSRTIIGYISCQLTRKTEKKEILIKLHRRWNLNFESLKLKIKMITFSEISEYKIAVNGKEYVLIDIFMIISLFVVLLALIYLWIDLF